MGMLSTAPVTISALTAMPAERFDHVAVIEQSGRGESRDLALIVPAANQHRLAVEALFLETQRLLRAIGPPCSFRVRTDAGLSFSKYCGSVASK